MLTINLFFFPLALNLFLTRPCLFPGRKVNVKCHVNKDTGPPGRSHSAAHASLSNAGGQHRTEDPVPDCDVIGLKSATTLSNQNSNELFTLNPLRLKIMKVLEIRLFEKTTGLRWLPWKSDFTLVSLAKR